MWKGWSVSRGTTSYSSFISLFLVASLEPAVLAPVVEQGRRVVAKHEAGDLRDDDRVVAAVVHVADDARHRDGCADHERLPLPLEVFAAERPRVRGDRSEEHTTELQSRENLVCRLLLELQKRIKITSK